MRKHLAWLFLAVMALSVSPASAEVCGPRREIIDAMKGHYGERESWLGEVAGQGATALLLTSKSGSWTFIIVRPDVACAVASGTGSTPLFGTQI